jgi:hypothetical protein
MRQPTNLWVNSGKQLSLKTFCFLCRETWNEAFSYVRSFAMLPLGAQLAVVIF